jgi:hypothetical protein
MPGRERCAGQQDRVNNSITPGGARCILRTEIPYNKFYLWRMNSRAEQFRIYHPPNSIEKRRHERFQARANVAGKEIRPLDMSAAQGGQPQERQRLP